MYSDEELYVALRYAAELLITIEKDKEDVTEEEVEVEINRLVEESKMRIPNDQ